MAITIVWTELFLAMRAPRNRRHELCPNKLKNKLFDQNFDLFMVKTWSNFGQKIYFSVYSDRARDDGYGELSWLEKARSKQ